MLLAAAAHGKAAIDAVYLNIPDLAGLAAEAEDASASGFTLKACIHPSQVAVVRTAFQADDAQVAWARRVLAAARDANGQDRGVLKVDGQMIDAPLLRQAEAILASVRYPPPPYTSPIPPPTPYTYPERRRRPASLRKVSTAATRRCTSCSLARSSLPKIALTYFSTDDSDKDSSPLCPRFPGPGPSRAGRRAPVG